MIKPPLMGRVSSLRVSIPVPVTMAAVELTTLPRRAPTLVSVMELGSSGATPFTRASLAATTTCLPIRARSLGENTSCSRPVEEASTASLVSSSMYSPSGRVHSFSRARSKASPSTSCLAPRASFLVSIWAADFSRSSRSSAAFRPRARVSAVSLSAWALAASPMDRTFSSVWAVSWAISASVSAAIFAVIFSIPFISFPPFLSGQIF